MTVRFKLAIGFIAITFIGGVFLSLVMVIHVNRVFIEEVQNRVSQGLNSARNIYDSTSNQLEQYLVSVSFRRELPQPLQAVPDSSFAELLDLVLQEGKLDILSLIDPEGRVIYRAHNPAVSGDILAGLDPIIDRAALDRRPFSGTIILEPERLALEGSDLLRRSSCLGAEPCQEGEPRSGMLIAASTPLIDLEHPEAFVGLLYGAVLLNGRFEIVDGIQEQLLLSQADQALELGTATIFQGDVRISTNVRASDGSRATGTQLSQAVVETVLQAGETYADRAFVVNDWYITAYQPIRDPAGEIIGALYVGLLERPFKQPQQLILGLFLPLVGLTTLFSLTLLLILIRQTLKPISQVIEMSRRIVSGDLTARVGIRPKGELGLMWQAIDQIAEAVESRERDAATTAKRQIDHSERLASIGRLAAGIAHEVNNPLTGVLTFAHLLRESPNLGAREAEDVEMIIAETERVRDILRNALDFARLPSSARSELDINQIICRTVALLSQHREFRHVEIEKALADDLPLLLADQSQLQQAFLNLTLNALEAMPNGGTLRLKTSFQEGQIVVSFKDSGIGIAAPDLEQIFDPFFTTKPEGKGTGLGLSVTCGIIQKHGGSLDVVSTPGEGTEFTMTLPVADNSPREEPSHE